MGLVLATEVANWKGDHHIKDLISNGEVQRTI